MHKLYIDVGNSYIKVATLEGVNWEQVFRCRIGEEEDKLYEWLEKRPEDDIAVCSVVERVSGELERRISGDRLFLISRSTIPSRLLDYRTPRTLGMDRFLPCYGAVQQVPGAVVVIDAGTACTVDYMSEDSIFRGGVIMPGMGMMQQVMSHQLPSLPEPDGILPDEWPGKTTIDSVRWGTTGSFFAAIENFLTRFESRYGTYTLFLTGGDAEMVSRYMESTRDVKLRPNLLFEGMHALLQEVQV